MKERTQALKAALTQASQRGRLTITGHDAPDVDSVVSCVLLGALCAYWGIPARIALPTRADSQVRRVLPRYQIDADALMGEITPQDELALVDHNQPLHPGHVAAVIDHHPTEHPPQADFVAIEPSGACAYIVYRLMEDAGMEMTDKHRELAALALYLDTIALRSVKIPKAEADWARAQAAALGMDEAWLTREGLGLRDMTLPAETLAMTGRKAYAFAGRRVISTYVQTNEMTDAKLAQILDVLREAVVREGARLWVFLVHDPMAMRSARYDIAPDGSVERVAYDVLASRGKTVMPQVERMMREEAEREEGRSDG